MFWAFIIEWYSNLKSDSLSAERRPFLMRIAMDDEVPYVLKVKLAVWAWLLCSLYSLGYWSGSLVWLALCKSNRFRTPFLEYIHSRCLCGYGSKTSVQRRLLLHPKLFNAFHITVHRRTHSLVLLLFPPLPLHTNAFLPLLVELHAFWSMQQEGSVALSYQWFLMQLDSMLLKLSWRDLDTHTCHTVFEKHWDSYRVTCIPHCWWSLTAIFRTCWSTFWLAEPKNRKVDSHGILKPNTPKPGRQSESNCESGLCLGLSKGSEFWCKLRTGFGIGSRLDLGSRFRFTADSKREPARDAYNPLTAPMFLKMGVFWNWPPFLQGGVLGAFAWRPS